MPDLVLGLAYYVVFLFSTTLHEAAHAWAAKLGGDFTAYHGGQVTLDPRPHIRREPIGMVVLPLISTVISGWPFGFASAPYDPMWAASHPRRAAWMSLAGPASNLALVLLAGLLMRVGLQAGVFQAPDSVEFGAATTSNMGGLWPPIATMLGIFFSLNLVLFVLNILPLPPLDGSGVVPMFLSPSTNERYQAFLHQPMLSLIGIIVAWRMLDFIFQPIFLRAVNLLYWPSNSYG